MEKWVALCKFQWVLHEQEFSYRREYSRTWVCCWLDEFEPEQSQFIYFQTTYFPCVMSQRPSKLCGNFLFPFNLYARPFWLAYSLFRARRIKAVGWCREFVGAVARISCCCRRGHTPGMVYLICSITYLIW